MIIYIFTEKHISPNFWTANAPGMVDPSFFGFWEIYILITHWWAVSVTKTSVLLNGAEWCHTKYFSWNRWKTDDFSKNIAWKMVKSIIFVNSNIIAFPGGFIHPNWTSGSVITAIQIERRKSRRQQQIPVISQARKFCEIARKCVKVNLIRLNQSE